MSNTIIWGIAVLVVGGGLTLLWLLMRNVIRTPSVIIAMREFATSRGWTILLPPYFGYSKIDFETRRKTYALGITKGAGIFPSPPSFIAKGKLDGQPFEFVKNDITFSNSPNMPAWQGYAYFLIEGSPAMSEDFSFNFASFQGDSTKKSSAPWAESLRQWLEAQTHPPRVWVHGGRCYVMYPNDVSDVVPTPERWEKLYQQFVEIVRRIRDT